MPSLRDQLLKTGIATKEQKQQVEQEKRRERKKHQKGRTEEASQRQQRQAHEARQEAQRVADRQRAAERRVEFGAREKRLRIQHLADYWQVPEDPKGTRRWYFTTRHNTIEYLYVSEPLATRLNAGEVAIIERPDAEESRHVLVEREAAEHILPIDSHYVRFSNG